MRFLFVCLGFFTLGVPLAKGSETNPVVRMLVPGFKVQQLPLKLSNLNNLRFAPDGRLFALGYDGRIHVLTDSDGDGLEDKDEVVWDGSGLSVPEGMAIAPEGIYVSSHGKISLLKDSGGDGRPDHEQVLATNWPPTDVGSGGVDATGITLDKHGDLFFGLIAADYSNPYRVKDGVSHYEPGGKRGTIQTLRHGQQEIVTVANGIRVPYALAFNRAGDLFCTDQEGETWCPNGNPLDELNQIVPGRNYGFPPRDEKWLTQSKMERPVVAFGPQHQSSCGMIFNEPRRGQGLFGPKWWEGDALVAGESRGKIWRVRLVKTSRGYIGKSFLIARLSMLTLDVAISPKGALYVCCHSGQPDWGTGPKGEGKIFKISYVDPSSPQPTLAWAAGPTEVRIAFDRAIEPPPVRTFAEHPIEFGEFVSAADRFEVLRPPYKVVGRQQASPRGKLKIVAAKMENDHTLALTTDPQPQAVKYALTIPELKSRGTKDSSAQIDLDYDLGDAFQSDDWVALARTLPHGRDLVASMKQKLFVFRDQPMARYPYIHNTEKLKDDGFQVVGGDFEKGRALFFGEQLKCSTCHRIRGEGKLIGPDLSNLVSKDVASVLKDIKEPNASINPDYVAYNVSLKDGETLTGFVRSQDENFLRLTTVDGKEQVFPRTKVETLKPSSLSLMPSGLTDSLKPDQMQDLLTFLLNAPPVHHVSELKQTITTNPADNSSRPPMPIVLVASKQDHGPAQHDYPAWQKTWHGLLQKSPQLEVQDAWLWPTPEQFKTAKVILFYYWNRDWNSNKLQEIDGFLSRGGGIVALHSATIGNPLVPDLAMRIGLSSDSGKTKYRHTPLDLQILKKSGDPILLGLPDTIHFLDEPYWPLIGNTDQVQVLASAEVDGQPRPLIWKAEKGKGRVFVSILGHYTSTLDDPWFRLIILRGLSWAGGCETSALDQLATQPHE